MSINKTKKASHFFHIVLLLIYAIVVLEISLRIFLYISLNAYFDKYISDPYRENIKLINLFQSKGSDWCKFDALCYYLPKKGLFRGPKGQIDYGKKEKEEIRVACIGDSTTYGIAVSYYESWPYFLERLLRNKYPYKDIRVLNAGIPGASSRQVKRIFQIHVVKYRPDIVIWRKGVGLSDTYKINKIPNFIRMFLWRCIYESRIFRVICVIKDKNKDWNSKMANRAYDVIMYRFSDVKEDDSKFDSDFSIIKKIAVDNEIKYVLAVDYLSCNKENNISSDYSLYLNKGLKPVVSTIEAFEEKLKEVSINDLFADDCHLTEKGTSIVAREIFKFLVDKRWIEKF